MGLTIDKILVIMVIAMFVLGPERLPMYAKKLGEFVRSIKRMTDGAKDRLRDEMGPEFDEVDWKQLDPRQYDPRRIIRDALVEDEREARLAARRERASEAAARRAAVAEAAGSGDAAAAVGDAATAVADGPAQTPRVRFDEEAT
ncbi:twin-arginine translocase TatA/TatE family subunit [Leucobacter celer]|uniref:twin-arginine translocase TatA/TatE family subunit n=1 Tax=Leucobacter celer TaxID=668625 RepID=UPI000A492787|nr:twin-arginine translocase TatA/TatE family subunit [Leucobacter celer]